MNPHTGTANERIGQQAVDLAEARRQRDELLEALSDARDILASPITAYDQHTWDVVLAKAQAAIEKVEK